jgi:hypothetical protein
MGQFDFYVLALSWSPGFCEISGSRSRQCDPGSGLGFVVHGLWPQNEGGYPSFCEPGGRFAPRAAVEEARGLFPDDNLARYQWRKHGTCTGEAPGLLRTAHLPGGANLLRPGSSRLPLLPRGRSRHLPRGRDPGPVDPIGRR